MRKKRKYDPFDTFKEEIVKHNKDLPISFNLVPKNLETDSWFDIKKFKSTTRHNDIQFNDTFEDQVIIKCQKVKMILNSNQKEILNKWFESYTNMYNEAVKFIRQEYQVTKYAISKPIMKKELKRLKENDIEKFYDFYYIRSQLMDVKREIQEKSISNNNKDTKIHIHTLDYAIRQLCSNIKGAKTNLRLGNIKRFRIKYWRHNRSSKSIDIENDKIKNGKLLYSQLGDIKYIYNNEEFFLDNIKYNVKINYNDMTKEYTLLIPKKVKNQTVEDKTENLISIDPGLRTFMSGITENSFVQIGNNVNKIITKSIAKLNRIKNNPNIPKKIKSKNEKQINRKIKNRVDDLHWKTIAYLFLNYKTILLGDMSAKGIVSKKNNLLSKNQKTACLRSRYYEFKMRLEYKCLKYNVNFKYVNESCTSKTCSNCGYYKKNLGGSHQYECDDCPLIINRDVNGARNIYIKNLL